MRQVKSKVSQAKIKKLVDHLSGLINESGLNQAEIARALSTDEHSYQQAHISLMRAGKVKIPIYLVPKLADLFNTDRREFLMAALEAYHPEVFEVINDNLSDEYDATERKMIDLWRKNGLGSGKKLSKTQAAKIAGFFSAFQPNSPMDWHLKKAIENARGALLHIAAGNPDLSITSAREAFRAVYRGATDQRLLG